MMENIFNLFLVIVLTPKCLLRVNTDGYASK